MTFSDMVAQSVLARAVAIIILAIVFLAAVGVGAFDLIVGRAIPPEINTIVGGGIGFSLTLVSINYGVILQPAKKGAAPTTQGGNGGNGNTNP